VVWVENVGSHLPTRSWLVIATSSESRSRGWFASVKVTYLFVVVTVPAGSG
jgi:hypothetical protein